MRDDIEALRAVFDTGQRAFWELAVSPHSYREVVATQDAARAHKLEQWFFEIWHYWSEFLRSSDDLPSLSEAEETRIAILSCGALDTIADMADRVLLCDAVIYKCDAFCTRDWKTLLRFRDDLRGLPLEIITPVEWWERIAAGFGIL